jgi:inhibitor of KinA
MDTNVVNISPSYFPMGDQAVVIQFENDVLIPISRRVQTFAHLIKHHQIPGVKQLLPAFNNLTVCYDPIIIEFDKLVERLRYLEGNVSEYVDFNSKTIHIPTAFGGEYGPDLKEISMKAGLSTEEVIKILHSKPYFVYMIGFIAGYPYCGDIDQRLALPRRSNPRLKVEKGTIQIVNNLTGIFTMTAPSGWHMVGWTPTEMFNPYREPPSMLRAGDYVQYVPISAKEAERWNEKRQREWDQEWNSCM